MIRGNLPLEAQVSESQIPGDQVGELADCFVSYARGLFGYACVLTQGDRALADDLVQSTFVAAAGQWATVRSLNEPQRLSWLRTTIGNLAISVFRRNSAFRDRVCVVEAIYRPPTADTHADALSAMALEQCWQTMPTLPPRQHLVAVMRWLFAMKNTEIASQLSISGGTVAAHLSQVRAKLRAELGPFDPFGADEDGASS
jgi:RNA polymerase sigma-70 factor (ECF subfamily)